MSLSNKTVVVTGFGLFADYQVNSSWVAAKELADIGLGLDSNIKLEIIEIPVEYDAINKKVPQLFRKHKPILVVHVGVSGLSQSIELEQCAHNNGYYKCDVKNKCPDNEVCRMGGPDMLHSSINMETIAESDELKEAGVMVKVSHDAGRYCCDYIYYYSLSMKECPVMFVHVPPLSQRFDGKTLAIGLRAIIRATLKHLNACKTV